MRHDKKLKLVFIAFLFILLTSVSVYAGFPRNINVSSNQTITTPFQLNGGIFPIPLSVGTSMSGTVKLTSPVSKTVQTIQVPNVSGGFNAQVVLNEIGIYTVEETYTLNANEGFLSMNESFTETRAGTYNNASSGTRDLRVTSEVSGFSSSIPPGNVSVVSFNPTIIESGQSVGITLRIKDGGIPAGGIVATSATVSAVWNVTMIITGGVTNNPPVVSISSASQLQPNGDVQVSYSLQDQENNSCNISAQYSIDSVTWSSATIVGDTSGVSPGTRSLLWKSYQDKPDAHGVFYIRIQANDGVSVSGWTSAQSVTLNNTATPNNPPSASNLEIRSVDASSNQEIVPVRAPVTGDKIKAKYAFEDLDRDAEKGSELTWYKNGAEFVKITLPNDPTQLEQSKILSQTVTRGERWYFSITPGDGKNKGETRTSPVVIIGNAPPIARELVIQPFNPNSSDDLKAEYRYFDPENDPEGASEILWYKDEILQSQYTNKTVVPASDKVTNKGSRWRFTVLPKDLQGAFSSSNRVSSSVVTIRNQEPIVEIVSVSGASGSITVTYNLIDRDGDRCNLVVWYRGGSASLGEKRKAYIEGTVNNVSPGNGLKLIWRSDMDEPSGKSDNYMIGITPNDGTAAGNDAVSARFSVDNNEAPEVTDVFISTIPPRIDLKTIYTGDDLKAYYRFSDPNDKDKESGTEIRWYRNNVEQTDYRNKDILPNAATKRDESWYFSVKPSDGKEFGNELKSDPVKIKNSPPVATEVKLEPAKATTVDDLKALYKYSDADGDPESGTQIKWYIDGSLAAQYNDKTLIPASDTTKGQTWHFTVLVSDKTDTGKLMESNRVKLGNMAPVIRGLIFPQEGYHDVPIKFELVDPDNDKCVVSIDYRGGNASTWKPATIREPLINLSSGKFTFTWDSAKDEDVRKPTSFEIRVIASDGTTAGNEAVSENFIKLDNNIPPIASNLKISPPNPTVIDNLIASYDYKDPDGGVESGSEIRWYKGNSISTDYKTNLLPASATLKGDSWYFTVKPRDGAKFGELQTSNPVTIINSPPLLKSVEIVPSNPKSGDTLTVKYDYRDLDDDREAGTEIQWYKNGVLQLAQIFTSDIDRKLSLSVLKGEKWHVVVKPKDGADFGTPLTSNTVAIGNVPPVVENVTISGESGDVTIRYSLIDNDGDKCDLTVEYQGGSSKNAWIKATIKEPITKVSPGAGLKLTWASRSDEPGQKADNYRIRITPTDGVSAGASFISLKFALSNNLLPSASNITVLPEMPTTSDDLKASYNFVDPDNDREDKPEIKWFRNGQVDNLYDGLTTLPASATARGDRWFYTIKVNDGKEYGKLQQSNQVTIGNEQPTVSDVVLSPEHPKLNERLVADYKYFDADGDTERGTKIEWYKNGVRQAAYTDLKSVPGAATSSGEEWYFTVAPKDGLDSGLPIPSNKVYVANLSPSVSSLNILPVKPLTTDDLVASYIYMDPENDPEKGTKITWYKNSAVQIKYNDMLKLPSEATARDQIWYFTVLPRDGKQFGLIKQSNFVVIDNSPPVAKSPSISPAYPLSKDDLVAKYEYYDSDGDLEGKSEIKWYRNGVWVPKYDGLKRLLSKEISDREIWHFTLRPKDDADYGDAVTSADVEVGSPIPRINNLTIFPENPLTNDDLTAIYVYTDPNGVPESGSQITWYKNGVAQSEYKNKKVLPSKATSKGEQWHFTVRPSNGKLFGEEQSSIPVVVVNSAPKLTAVVPQPKEPTTDDNILADYIYEDPDGDVEVRNEIKWYRNKTLQPAYNDMKELPASANNRNEEWYFTVKVSDGETFSELATSTTAKIKNGKPRVTNPVISPANPKTNDDLKLQYTYADTESDPESGTEVEWFKNNVSQPNLHNLRNVSAEFTSRDDRWHSTIKPRDGIDYGSVVTSPIVAIGNTRPAAVDVTAVSDRVLRGKSVIIVAHGKDEDSVDSGPALKCQVEYKIGNTLWTALNAVYSDISSPHWEAIFSPASKAQLGLYDFRAKFIDPANAESDWLQQDKIVTVDNSPPFIDTSADDLHAKEDIIKEFDLSPYGSDLESGKNLIWKIDPNSVNTQLFQASIIRDKFLEIKPVDNKNGKDDITIILTDEDGGKFEKTDVTIIVDPVNDPPLAPALIKITPETPRTTDTLVCEASGSIDPDGDVVPIYRYQWYSNGAIQPDLKARDVPYVKTSKGEVWRCEVTPSDGIVDGPLRYVEVTIGNTPPVVTNLKVTGNTRDIRIAFDLEDADNDKCEIKLEYRIKGKAWKLATIDGIARGIAPGTGLSLTWKSSADEDNVVTDDCRLRVTPSDGSLSVDSRESESFLLDNKPPVFTVTTVANPVYHAFIVVTVVSDEKLTDPLPDVSAAIKARGTVALKMESVGENTWTGNLELEPGFSGVVLLLVKGTDLVGNAGKLEVQREFDVPAPMTKPDNFVLSQNYPNPAIKETRIPYQLSESSTVIIKIYNSAGRLVRTLDEGYNVAGFYDSSDKAAHWDIMDDNGNPVAPGIYFYHLKAGIYQDIKKMVVER